MWRKVQCLQNVKSCQISIGRSVLINTVFVGKEEEVPSVESISKVWFPGKKPQSILLLLEDGAKVSVTGASQGFSRAAAPEKSGLHVRKSESLK